MGTDVCFAGVGCELEAVSGVDEVSEGRLIAQRNGNWFVGQQSGLLIRSRHFKTSPVINSLREVHSLSLPWPRNLEAAKTLKTAKES